jgi:hypothetical protein
MAALIISGKKRICPQCNEERAVESFRKYRIKCRLCRGFKSEYPKFRQPTAEELAPVKSPTTLDIAWAAGIWEGEGSVNYVNNGSTTPSFRVSVCQKDPEILYKLRSMFGGSILKPRLEGGKTIHVWYLYTSRAHGFMLTLFSFLSTRRRIQIRKALVSCGC